MVSKSPPLSSLPLLQLGRSGPRRFTSKSWLAGLLCFAWPITVLQAGALPVTDEPLLWLDASDENTLSLDGDAVTQWSDKSGKGNHATQASATEQPTLIPGAINGKPALDFDFDKMAIGDIDMLGKMLVAVVQPDVFSDAAQQVISHSSVNVQLRINTAGTVMYAAANPIYPGSSSTEVVPAGSPSIVCYVLNTQMSYSVNGTFEESGATNDGSGDTTYNQIGARQAMSEALDGKIGEILVLDSVSADDRQRLEGYLAHKWGLAASLPDGHPFKAVAPKPAHYIDLLKVDFGQNTPDPLQEGYEAFFPWEPGDSEDNGDAQTYFFDNDAGLNGSLDVTVEGQTHWRDYAAVTGGPSAGMSALLSDSVLRNANGTLTLTLTDLKAGTYTLRTYHHDTDNGPGVWNVTVSDANRTDAGLGTYTQFPESTAPPEILILNTEFEVTDGDLVMKWTKTGGGHLSLNGFDLLQTVYSDIPVLTLNGDNPIRHEMGTNFTDPGVTATDTEDGTLSADKITVSYETPWFEPDPIAPDTYPGLQLWLKADEGFIPGGWQDQSGNARDATANGSPELIDAALNGLPVMRYVESDKDFHSFPEIRDLRTAFWVVKRNKNQGFLLGSDNDYHFHSANNQFWDRTSAASYTHANIHQGRLAVNGGEIDGFNTNMPNQMSVISLRTTGNVTAGTFSRDRTAGYRHFDGDLAELLIYNTPLEDAQIQDIETRLAIKWGLPWSPIRTTTDTLDTNVLGVWDIHYTATDSHGLQASITRKLEVFNPNAPVITLVGEADLHHELGNDFTDPGFSVADKDGGALDANDAVVDGEVDGHTPGTYLITYDFNDGNGNDAVRVVRTVTVSDSLPPEIDLAGGESIKHPIGQPFIDPGYSAEDLVDGKVMVQSSLFTYDRIRHRGFDDAGPGRDSLNFTNNGGILNEEPDGEVFLTRALYITGWNNNPDLIPNDFNIPGLNFTHKDQNRSVFTGYFHAKVGGDYEFGVAREDDDGTFFLDLDQDGLFEQPGDAGNEWINGGYGAAYKTVHLQPGLYKYAAGHYQGGSGQTIEIKFSTPYGAGPTILTTVDPSIPNQAGLWLTMEPLDTSVPGTHTITYQSVDSAGNVSTATRTVEIVEVTDPPVITLQGRAIYQHEQYTDYTDPGYTVADADGNPLNAGDVHSSTDLDTHAAGTYEVIYTFFDDNGIPAEPKTRVVNVVDTVVPSLELVGDAEVTIVAGEVFTDPGVTILNESDDGVQASSNAPIRTDNLFMHLDAAKNAGFSPGDVVLKWRDISGNGNDLDDVRGDAVIVAESIGGLPAVRVNGDDFLGASGTEVGNHYSVFTVSQLAANNGHGRLLSSRSRNWFMGYGNALEDIFYNRNWVTSTTTRATTDPHIYTAVHTGSKVRFFADGVDKTVGSGNNEPLGRFQVGGRSVVNEPARGDVAEVLIYKDYAVTESERLHIHTYLASKYGLWNFPQTPPPDLSVPGEHTVTYFAQDKGGNVGTVTRKVIVTPDPEKPSIELVGEAAMTLEYGSTYEEPGVTVKDGAGQVVDNPDLVVTGAVDTTVLGLHTIAYDYTSTVAANTVLRSITIVDTTPPAFTLTGGEVIRIKVGETFTDPGFTAEDARNGTVAVYSDLNVTQEGLVLHLDAGSLTGVVANDANISKWVDQSGNLHHADNISSDPKWIESGLNSLPVVDFDGNDLIWTSHNFEAELFHYTVFSVARYSGNTKRIVISSRNRDWRFGFDGNKTEAFYSHGWAINQGPSDQDWHLHAGDVNNADQANFWRDGVQLLFNGDGLSNSEYMPKVIQLGGRDNRDHSQCQVAEVLLFNRVLPSEERDLVVNYLNTKYNLNGGGDFANRFDLSQPGSHTITYHAFDDLGNKSTATRNLVVVADDTKPYIVLNGDAEVRIEAATIAEYTDPGAKAFDAAGQDLNIDLTGQGTVDSGVPGTYTLTYSHTDADDQVRTVIVKDTQGPAIALNEEDPVTLFLGAMFQDPGGVGTDVLDGETPVYSPYLPVPDIMVFEQYPVGNNSAYLDFSNEGGLLSFDPDVRMHISDGQHGDGIKFLNDMDFRRFVGNNRYDGFQNLATGQFHAKKEGIYEFQAIFNRDYIVIWLDKDQDGYFERAGDLGDERVVWGNTTSTVYLKAGHYRVAFANSAGTGDAQMHIKFRAPEGAGPTTLTTVHPGGPGQEGLWSTWPAQIDTSVPGTHTIEYFSDDAAGNRTTATRHVIVEEDTEKPVIYLLGQASIFLHAGSPFAEPGYELTDFEGNPLDGALVMVTGAPDGQTTGTFNVRYEYTDPDGHTAVPKVRIVTIEDILPPEMTLVGANPLVHPTGEPFVDPGALALDANEGLVRVYTSGAPFSPFILMDIGPNGQRAPQGWVAVGNQNNNAGNKNMGFTDVFAPGGETFKLQISHADWRDRGDSSSVDPLSQLGEDFIKQNAGDITLHFRDFPAGDYIFTTYHLDPTFDQSAHINIHLTDARGSDALQEYTGNASRVVALDGITSLDLAKTSSTFPVTATGTSDVIVRIDGQYPDRETPLNGVAIQYPVTTPQAGTYNVTYYAVDSHGNESQVARTIIVKDVSGVPAITLVGEKEMTIDAGSLFEDPGVSLKDKVGAHLDASLVQVSGSVETEVLGTYFIGYDYTDGEGNVAATVTRTVHVEDLSPPIINLVGGDTIRHQLGNVFIEPGFSAEDYVDGSVLAVSSEFKADSIRLRGYKGGEQETIHDLHGNGGLLNKVPYGILQNFTGEIYTTSNGHWQNFIPGLGNGNFQVLFDGLFRTSTGGIYEFGHHNADDTASFWIDLDGDGVFEKDGDKGSELINIGYKLGYREVTLPPGEYRYAIISLQGGSGYRVQARYRAVSGVGPGSLVNINPSDPLQAGQWIVRNPIDVLALGEHQITYTSVDAAGNVGTVVRTVIVENNPDAAILSLLGEEEITLPYGGTYNEPGVSIKDLDGNDLSQDKLVINGSVDTSKLGKHTLEYNYVTDAGIPARTISRTIHVVDDEAPVITLAGDADMTVTQGSAFVDPGYSATDNYDGDIILVGSSQNFPSDGLVLHLDASSILGKAEGDPVSLWFDLSPHGHDADVVFGTPTYAADSINGRPAVRFDGTSRLGTSKDFGGTYTIFSVSRMAGTSNQRLITSRNVNWTLGYIGNTQDRFHVPSGPSGWVTSGSPAATTDPKLYSASSGDGRIYFYANGVDKTTYSQRNNGTIGFFQMGAWMDGREASAGDVAEVILYNRVLTESERRGVEAGLNAKYSLNGVTGANTPVDTSQLGEYTVIYQAADLAGNIATETRTVTVVEDPSAPTITLNGDTFVVHEASDTYTDDGAVLKDSNDQELGENLMDVAGEVIPNKPGLYSITYSYTPDTGTPAVAMTRTVEVRDTLPPVVTLTGPAVVKLEIGETYTEEGATATDQATGAVPALDSLRYTFGQLAHFGYKGTANDNSYVDIANGGGLLGMTPAGETFFTNGPGGRGLDFNGDGDFRALVPEINVNDKYQNLFHGVLVAPVDGDYEFHLLEVNGSNPSSLWLDLDKDGVFKNPGTQGDERLAGPTQNGVVVKTLAQGVYRFAIAHRHWTNTGQIKVLFARDGAVPVTLKPANPNQTGYWASVSDQAFDSSQAGTFTIEYTAYDAVGNAGTATRTVVVVADATLPFIALNGGLETQHELGTPFTDPQAVVTSGQTVLKSDLAGQGTVDADTLGEYTLTYDYTHTDGKVAETVTRKVIVVDRLAPVPTLVAHANGGTDTVTLTVGTEWVDPGITIQDGDADAFFVSSRDYIPGRLAISGYMLTSHNDHVSFDKPNSLFSYEPAGQGFLTTGVSGRGYEFLNDNEFRNVPSGISRNDQYQLLTHGYFRAPVTGNYEFRTEYHRNHQTFWLDLARDGTFEQSPDRLTWGQVSGNIDLLPGFYRVALGFYHINGQGTARFLFKTPEGGGFSNALTILKPAAEGQSTLWYSPGDGPIDTTFPGTHHITYYAMDNSDNQSTLHRTVIIEEDPDAPVLTLQGEANIAHQQGEVYNDAGVVATDKDDQTFTDPAPTTTITHDGLDVAEVDGTILGTYEIQYDLTDGAGKSAIPVFRTVVVADTAPPVITLAGENPITIQPGVAYFDAGATAVDSLDGDVDVKVSSSSPSFGAYQSGLLSGSIPGSGQKTAPNPGNLGVDPLGPSIAQTNGAPWVDNITFVYTGQIFDADGVMSFRESIDDGTYLKVNGQVLIDDGAWNNHRTASVDFGEGGWFDFEHRVYNAVGGKGQVVAPGFGWDPEGGENYVAPENSSDTSMNLFRVRPVYHDSVKAASEGIQTITYTATDAAGNTATEVRQYVVKDDLTLPTIVLQGELEMNHEAGTPFVDPGYTAQDRRGNDLPGDVQVEGTVDHTQLAGYTLVYNYTDPDGVQAPTQRRIVTVVDTTAPTIELTDGSKLRWDVGKEWIDPGYTITDNLDTGLTADIRFIAEGLQPVVHWEFDEEDGGVANELMAGLNGTLTNFPDHAAARVLGKYGKALSFDGTNSSYVEIPATDILDLQAFTISVWVKSDDYNRSMFLFEKSSNNTVNSQYNFFFENDNSFSYRLIDDGSTINAINVNSAAEFIPDVWQHIVVTYDSTVQSLYVEGELVASDTPAVTLATGATGKSYIGATAPGDSYYYTGLVDDLKIYNFAVTESQVAEVGKRTGVVTSAEKKSPPYTLTYTTSDAMGNTTTVERKVVVSNDVTPPSIVLLGDAEIEIELNSAFTDPGILASDNVDEHVNAALVDVTGTVDTSKTGVYTITYSVSDLSFNQTTVTRTVTVVDPNPGTDPFDTWKATKLASVPEAKRDLEADPDHDRVPNLLEYAIGGNPTSPDRKDTLPEATSESGSLKVTFLRIKASVDNTLTYKVELTRKLKGGTWSEADVTVTVDADQTGVPADYERVTATSNTPIASESQKRQFIRITVEKP